jgi:phage baseplate assembly protein V
VSFQVPRSDRRTGGVGSFENTEGARQVENLIRTGKVLEVDLDRRLLRVQIGELETAWLPVLEPSASATRGGLSAWAPPREGDVVQLLCPGGELTLGMVLPSQFMHADDAPFRDRAEGYEFGALGEPRDGVYRQLFGDGTLLEYDLAKKLVRVETPGSINAHAEGQVIIKSPFIRLDCDACHVTGKLLLSDQVIGMKKDLSGTRVLDLLGDPIHLNNKGGVFGIAGSLISGFGLTSMAGAIGNFGSFGGLFNNLVSGIGAPMNLGSFLGAGGLLGAIPSDILGAGFNALGVNNVLAPLSSAMGFVQSAVQGVTDPWGMANFAGQVASAAGVNVGPITDGFAALQGMISNGQVNLNTVAQVAQGAGRLPGTVGGLASTVGQVLDTAQTLSGGSLTPQGLMQGLRSGMAAITDPALADTINDTGVVETWEMLFQGEVQPGEMIASFVNSGQVNLESLLNVATPLQRGEDTTHQDDVRTEDQQQEQPSSSAGPKIRFNQPN